MPIRTALVHGNAVTSVEVSAGTETLTKSTSLKMGGSSRERTAVWTVWSGTPTLGVSLPSVTMDPLDSLVP
ncbi:MAG: hypothetical protein ACJA00_002241 [Myxococcota bacterium]|jgi:hypothetical protein